MGQSSGPQGLMHSPLSPQCVQGTCVPAGVYSLGGPYAAGCPVLGPEALTVASVGSPGDSLPGLESGTDAGVSVDLPVLPDATQQGPVSRGSASGFGAGVNVDHQI